MATHVCVLGSANLDSVFAVTALPAPGETVLSAAPSFQPGGKGANQAVAAARAGARVQFVGAVGDDDAGRRLREHLRHNGVGTAGLTTVPGPSGSAIITVDPAGENTIVVAPGANGALTLNPVQHDLITACDVLLMQLEIPLPTVTAAARLAHDAGATVILNVSPPTGVLPDLAGLIDVAVVNESESAHFSHRVPHRVVTLGAGGVRYRGVDGALDIPAPQVRAVDTSGAGDVFAGVLATEWRTGIEDALRSACVAGALATLRPGAGDCAPGAAQIGAALAALTAGEPPPG